MAIVLGSKLVTTVSNAFKKEPIRKCFGLIVPVACIGYSEKKKIRKDLLQTESSNKGQPGLRISSCARGAQSSRSLIKGLHAKHTH
uniref:Uncharacterized protein n=1 Tax=Ditylenchus dipsaci TaxID=166011 RepID=A0A915EBV5_9BILA